MTQYKIKTTHSNGLPGIDHASGDAGYSSQLGSPMQKRGGTSVTDKVKAFTTAVTSKDGLFAVHKGFKKAAHRYKTEKKKLRKEAAKQNIDWSEAPSMLDKAKKKYYDKRRQKVTKNK